MHESFWGELHARLARYDLLCHPFYQAWSAGTLTRRDLGQYAAQYYPHVEAFPSYLGEFAERLPEGNLKTAVLENRDDELGNGRRTHAELWLDFAAGMGVGAEQVHASKVPAEMKQLLEWFSGTACEAAPAAVLAAFYAYESQVPRVASEKARGLREMYGANADTCRYFTLHTTADVHHSNVWREQLNALLEADPSQQKPALDAAEEAARRLWVALDGIEAARKIAA